MSDRNNPESRWSSVNERQEREKRRAAAREEAKRVRLAREANTDPTPAGSDPGQRRLTDEERRTIREYRFPTASDRDRPGTTPARRADQPVVTDEPSATAPSLRQSSPDVSTRWRDAVAPGANVGGSGLPDLPGEGAGSGGRKRPGNGRLLVFGLGLFGLMAVVAFLPFGPFSDDRRSEAPTPSATLPSILNPQPGEDDDDGAAEPRKQPVGGEGQPIVCIDPGHGGWDPGWNRTDQGDNPYGPPTVNEAALNLGMAYMLKAELEALDMFVVLTRPSGAAVNIYDEDVNGDGETRRDADNTEQAGDRDELQARINVCNEAGADVLISLHINGFDERDARGYEILYTAEREFGEQNAELAISMYRQLDAAMRETDMGGTGRGERPDTEIDIERYDFGAGTHYLLTGPAVEEASITPSEMPGAIVEAGFLSNDADAVWLVQPANQQIVVEAYARGIVDYFDSHPPE
jgi:N-acetylmuramoyl-L-alanine amidase